MINWINWEPLASQDEIQNHSPCLAFPSCHCSPSVHLWTPQLGSLKEYFQKRILLL